MNTPNTDDRLREAFDALATGVRADPAAYRRASAGWRRRERRRRLVLAILAALVFAAADAVGLWALSQADPNTHVIFSDPGYQPVEPGSVDRIGQP
ncbi:hypothetical protein [Pseudonocardia kunmingensis]|uniref:Uncharacterized protein n=1 Tax=Pseudonocardia kunmingensis TaxID=630975 RepID=A0A543E1E7_9PSEU|nr:hypothetical protein [Pseudonocardia kunmingensis]TQM15402.1 hypothetical protein FB558_2187 [Pseudonocardia kunmingensis]